ncbi:hypothetical protein BpHYR1_014247 [Brachionus plicatilis]|uniref:Uncharacterized protein n=1 Tax=Brachionus plicatilis TaxID=10195 RepID=A0A3M7SBP7_BRAPC|nr:hypothetical protein BpHYR1_014247 [Brachionus plicatilis]
METDEQMEVNVEPNIIGNKNGATYGKHLDNNKNIKAQPELIVHPVFLENSICYHIVACCILNDIDYLESKDKIFYEMDL